MRPFADIKADSSLGRCGDKFRNETNHLHRACYVSAARGGRYFTTLQTSGGGLSGQPFKFRNQMLERFEILNCSH